MKTKSKSAKRKLPEPNELRTDALGTSMHTSPNDHAVSSSLSSDLNRQPSSSTNQPYQCHVSVPHMCTQDGQQQSPILHSSYCRTDNTSLRNFDNTRHTCCLPMHHMYPENTYGLGSLHNIMSTGEIGSDSFKIEPAMQTTPTMEGFTKRQRRDPQQINTNLHTFQRCNKRRLNFQQNNQTPNQGIHTINNRSSKRRIQMSSHQELHTHERRLSNSVPLEYVHMGCCSSICHHCKATFWESERRTDSGIGDSAVYNRCCYGGRVVLRDPPEYPAYIKQLFKDPHFINNIRAYNQMFSMTSLGANVDTSINNGKGPYVFKISGQIYHWIGSMCPEEGQAPRFLQLYIYDTHNEVANRMAHFGGEEESGLKKEIVESLIEFLDNHNALVQLFRTARNKRTEVNIPEFKLRLYSVIGTRRYDLPTPETIGAIIFGGKTTEENDFDLIVEEHSQIPQRVNKLHPCYMALQFPLLFLYGEEGYQKDMRLTPVPGQPDNNQRRLSMNMYYAYQIHDRINQYSLLPRGGRLFQQYVVTAYCAVEQTRLDYIRRKQNEIRNEYLSGIYDAILRGDRDGHDLGTRTVLTAGFTGGPRYMYAHYLDALAICRVHGNPSFFITFTCNPKWPEIQQYMESWPELTTADRAYIVDRVFEQKVRDYVKFVWNTKPFGDITAVLYTIEFQKRGLPHCHSLIWVSPSSKIQQDVDVDKYISAELPDPMHDAEGYRVISEFMIHGPCGYANRSAPCMKDGNKCDRNFPKPYCDATSIDKDGFVHYRRRQTNINVQRQQIYLDNSYVVPFNRALCMRYYAHINVEYCGWTMMIKYLFKYISKGTDRVVANITTPIGETESSSTGQMICVDEIKNFVEARYIGPHEACWRILEFPIHYRDPAVLTLAVHSPNMQQITFKSTDNLQAIVDSPTKKKTTLTEWLAYNEQYTDGRHLTYLNFPSEYTWNKTDKYWQRRRRQNKGMIGRLTYIHPNAGDLFYQRILLCHQLGCKSFLEIRTVNRKVYPTNRAACEALGLIGNDQEWVTALQEAAFHASADQLRKLFVQILMFCDISNPSELWEKFWKEMSEDVPRRLSRLLQIPHVERNETEMKRGTLFELEALLNCNSKTLKDFGLPMPPKKLLRILENRLIMEERNYDRELLLKEKDILLPKLNQEQKVIFDEVMNGIINNQQTLSFVYGHGGTGKTFLWKCIACVLRSEEKVVLAVASSGIASLLLPSGRTAHSRFKIPLNLHEECVCSIKKNSKLADLLRETDLIIWDEAPMNDRRCFEALDRCLRDVLNSPETLFGGKSIILGGDFRQTLPVKKKASKPEVIDASITASTLWPGFKVHTLHKNMRLSRSDMTEDEKQRIQQFSAWLLDIGNGNVGQIDETDMENSSIVQIPEELCILDGETAMKELIHFTYDRETFETPTAEHLEKKVIVCPKNETADGINKDILALLRQQC